ALRKSGWPVLPRGGVRNKLDRATIDSPACSNWVKAWLNASRGVPQVPSIFAPIAIQILDFCIAPAALRIHRRDPVSIWLVMMFPTSRHKLEKQIWGWTFRLCAVTTLPYSGGRSVPPLRIEAYRY